MPNIVEYDAKGDITPSDKGINAAQDAARVYAQTGRELAGDVRDVADTIQRHMAIMETSELYKTGTELKLNLQKRYEEESGLPENRNDPHFGDRFMAEVGPILDKWGEGAGTEHGQTLAITLKASIRNELFNHVAAGQAEMDAAHVEDNLNQTMSLLGAGLILDPSEGNLARTLDTTRTAIQGMTMGIPDVATRERMTTEFTNRFLPQMVAARYRGVAQSVKNQIAETGGETSPALEQMDKDIAAQVGFQYLPPEAQAQLETVRDQAVSQGQELYRTKQADIRRQEDDAIGSAILNVESKMFKDNGAGGVTVAVTPELLDEVQQIATMPGAARHADDIRVMMNAMHTSTQDVITGKERTTDHATYNGLTARIGSTSNPLTKADVDKARDKLSENDYSFLRGAAADSGSADPKINHALSELHGWLGRIKPMIDKSDPLGLTPDVAGAAQYSYFYWDAEAAFRRMIAAGHDPDAAVQGLTNPTNPNSLYRYIPQYQTPGGKAGAKQLIEAIKAGNSPIPAPHGGGQAPPAPNVQVTPAAPRKPNESAADYLKRTGQ